MSFSQLTSLNLRLLLPAILTGIVLLLIGSSFTMNLIIRDHESQLNDEMERLLNQIVYAIETSQSNELQRQISVIASEPYINSILILSSDSRKVMVSSSRELLNQPLSSLAEATRLQLESALSQQSNYTLSQKLGDTLLLSRATYIRNPHLSTSGLYKTVVYLEVDTHESSNVMFREALAVIVWQAMLLITLLILTALLIKSVVLSQISNFRKTITRHAEGQTHAHTQVLSSDELGQLAAAFNSMVDARIIAEQQTEQARHKQQLSEARYENIIHSAMDGIIVIDEKYNVEIFNPMAEEMFGIPAEDIIGKSITKLIPERFQYSHEKHIDEFATTSSPGRRMSERSEIYALRSDGTEFPIEASISKSHVNDRVYMTAIVRDVTHLHNSQRILEQQIDERTHELQLSESRLNEAQFMAHIGNWELDLVENHLYWSDEIFRIFGINKDKFSASYEGFLNAIHPDDRDMVNNAYTNSLETRQAYQITHRLRMQDGEIKYVIENCRTHYDDNGIPLRSVGTVQDITSQVLSQQDAELNRKMLQTIIDSSPDWIYAKDRELQFLLVNSSYASAMGQMPQDMIGRKETDFIAVAQDGSSRRENHNTEDDDLAVLSGNVVRDHHDIFFIHGKDNRILDTYKAPMVNAEGDVYGVLAYSRDITERVKNIQALQESELRLRELNDSLEQRVDDRTRELKIAKETAEQANRAKSDFLSRMSHELRTPMNAILGFTQLLQLSQLDEEQYGMTEEVEQAGNHLLKLIDELLDLSRIEAGRLTAVVSRIELSSIVAESLSLVNHLAEQRGVRIINRLKNSDDHIVYADETRIRQVIVNLLSNAIKYNRPDGDVIIDAELKANKLLRFSISDTGYGISEDKMNRLFRPFERLGAEYSSIEGTGIGLVLSKKLIELMGGSMGVTSSEGAGSSFWFELSAAQPDWLPLTISASETGDETSGDNDVLSIVYVEDNLANLRLIEAGLKNHHEFKLHTATDGKAGFELIHRINPDVVILDINLPEHNGYEILRSIRRDPHTRHLPVIALSADAMRHDIEKGLKAGFSYYFTKPVDLHQLISTLMQIHQMAVSKNNPANS